MSLSGDASKHFSISKFLNVSKGYECSENCVIDMLLYRGISHQKIIQNDKEYRTDDRGSAMVTLETLIRLTLNQTLRHKTFMKLPILLALSLA